MLGVLLGFMGHLKLILELRRGICYATYIGSVHYRGCVQVISMSFLNLMRNKEVADDLMDRWKNLERLWMNVAC